MKIKFQHVAGIAMIIFCTQTVAAQKTTITAPAINNEITGISGDVQKNALARLSILQKDFQNKQISAKQAYKLLAQGETTIQEAIKPFGYFKSTVSERLTQDDNKNWLAIYHVNPGPQLHVTKLSMTVIGPGKDDKEINALIPTLPLKEGDAFDTNNYNLSIDKLLAQAHEEGYLKAKFDANKIMINLNNYLCSITITLNTGPQYYFGNISFGETPLSEKFLRRYLIFKPGDPFSYDILLRFQQNLSSGGYFSSASVVPDIQKATHYRIPMEAKFQMNKRREYKFGIGYGTNTGIRGTVGYSMRWVNRYGHQFDSSLQLSQIQQYIAAQYIIPGKNPSISNWMFTTSFLRLTPKRGKSFTKSIGASHIRNYANWQRTLTLNYEIERYRFDENDPYKSSKLLMPSVTFTYTTPRNELNVKNGQRFSLTMKGASTDVVSTATFLQPELQYKLISTLLEGNRFVLKADCGYTIVHDLTKLPLSKRFYAGGIQSVRGYSFKGLGPGKYLVIGSAEYQREIVGNFYAAIFYDIGNAINHATDPLKRGAGIGAVWLSPIGNIQLYVARPLSYDGNPLRFEFSLGPDL
ncbi:MAG: autotransporter assembly complex family protein [Pseudomonadota bacterium]